MLASLRWFAAIVLLSVASASLASEAVVLSARQGITVQSLRRHVEILADDTFEGREAGSRGGRAASGYLADQFRKIGLAGGGVSGGYAQPFDAASRNLLGVLEGSDPKLKDQVVVIAAHYDHVGYGSQRNSYGPTGYIHNGADDNASGVAGLLEVARAIAGMPERPRRTILFALWDAEEQGLLGSKYWMAHPTLPRERVVTMINMDMIGRLRRDRLEVYGCRTAPGLRRLVSSENTEAPLTLNFTWELKPDSDHWPFYEAGIPILMFHTGLHENYHRPSDDIEYLNLDGIRHVSSLACGTVLALANAPQLGPFRAASRNENQGNRAKYEYALPAQSGRLGLQWSARSDEQSGLRVTRVLAGSPAARAGLQPEDRILKFGDTELASSVDFQSLVLRSPVNVQTVVQRGAEKEPRTLAIRLAHPPVRVGLSWRVSDAEPGVVIVTRVVPGSPAARAGLRPHDRIDRVNSADVTGSDAFGRLLREASEQCELSLERNGRPLALSLELPEAK